MGQKKDLKCFEGLMLQKFTYSFPNILSTNTSLYCARGEAHIRYSGGGRIERDMAPFLGTREETLHTRIREDCVVQKPRWIRPGRWATVTRGRGLG